MLTPDQKQRRLGRITSSVAAGCLGLDEYLSPLAAWCEIVGESYDGAERRIDARACERGSRLESLAIEYGAERLGKLWGCAVTTERPGFQPIANWGGASTDAIYRGAEEYAALCEAKTCALGGADAYGAELTDEIPYHALIQSHMHLLAHPGFEVCYVPVIVGGHSFEFRLYQVARDDKFLHMLEQDLIRFHETYVKPKAPPPVACLDQDWLTRRHPRHVAKKSIPDTDALRLAALRKQRASIQRGYWNKMECAANAEIKSILGDAEECRGYWGKVTWRNQRTRTVTDWETLSDNLATLARDYGASADVVAEICSRHQQEKPGRRVLRVLVKKEYAEESNETETEANHE